MRKGEETRQEISRKAAPIFKRKGRAVEINVRCGDVTHRWAAQQCLIRMVRLQ